MTTGGEGGMMTTNDQSVWERAWSYRDHGRDRDAVTSEGHPPGYRWVYHFLGTNWRLTEMQSALGRRMLGRVQDSVGRRRKVAGRLSEAFGKIAALRTPTPESDVEHAFYRYYAFVRPERLRDGWNRDRVLSAVAAEGVPCFSGGCPEVYRERAFEGWRPLQRLKVARELGETSLAFPVHPTIADDDVTDTITAVQKVMEHASI